MNEQAKDAQIKDGQVKDGQVKDAPEEKSNDVKKKTKLKIFLVLLSVLFICGAGAGIYFIWQNAGYLTTDNARVTTNLISIAPNIPGPLERFTIGEGTYVRENEIIGWVEHGEAMRSPVDGLVVYASAVQGQAVSPMVPLAVIADTNRIHIQANIEETDILRVQLGQQVFVTVDGLGNQQFTGYVAAIGSITQAEIAGQTLFFNTGGTFTRVTHLIPVEINIVDDVNLDSLIGVNARVRFPIRNTNILSVPSSVSTGNDIISWGVVESSRSRNVYSMIGSRIEAVNVEVGDFVTEGQVLATLETEDLVLTIAQHRADFEIARQAGRTAIEGTQRMFGEASANLANNVNIHILSAQAALEASAISLEAAQRNYNDALRDYTEGTNPQVLNAESFLRTAATELEAAERQYTNLAALYSGGVLSAEEMRQVENALTHAQNQYDAARTAYENATEFQQRNLEQLRIALQGATAAHQQAQGMNNAARIAATQEIEMLRNHVETAEIAANLESMEIALQILERQLEESTITAPISGTVTAVIAREGELGMGPLFVIEDLNSLRVMTRFREYDLARLEEGQEVKITSDGTGDAVYSGVITRINPAADAHAPVAEFEAEVGITSVGTGLRVGMNARVSVAS